MGINAFIDRGYEPREFPRFYLLSPDFRLPALRRLAQRSGKKEKLAVEIAARFNDGEVAPSAVLEELARQPRTWLSFKLGHPERLPELKSPNILLRELGEDEWHGPVRGGDRDWYLRPVSLPYYEMVDGKPRPRKIRWMVMAEVTESYLAFKWDNFTYSATPEAGAAQFPFWKHLPELMKELELSLGGDWSFPNLHRLVLHDLWDRYLGSADYAWEHLRLRAMSQGVALNAKSAGVTEIDVRGLEALTQALAESAVSAIDGVTPDQRTRTRVEEALLRTLIHKWGTNSYEFRLMGKREGRRMFRGHCYFGLGAGQRSQDSFQHINCFHESGASNGALEFLLEHL